jgi:hypothetical protein
VLLLAGAAITSASVGSLSQPAFGFLVFGMMLLLAAILAAVEESE